MLPTRDTKGADSAAAAARAQSEADEAARGAKNAAQAAKAAAHRARQAAKKQKAAQSAAAAATSENEEETDQEAEEVQEVDSEFVYPPDWEEKTEKTAAPPGAATSSSTGETQWCNSASQAALNGKPPRRGRSPQPSKRPGLEPSKASDRMSGLQHA